MRAAPSPGGILPSLFLLESFFFLPLKFLRNIFHAGLELSYYFSYLCYMESKKVITLDTSVNKDIMLRVRITPYIDNELNRLSDKWGCTKSDLVRVMLLNSLELINEIEEE